MKVVIQIVDKASVSINSIIHGQINKGYCIFVGFDESDNVEIINKMVNKIINMRVFEDENQKTNLTLKDVDGEILSISQFTLCADYKKRRPSFSSAAKPLVAKPLYELFNKMFENNGYIVKTGIFGEEMIVSLVNHGPFTIVLSDKDL